MPEPVTLTVAAFLGAQLATAASGPLQGLGDRMFCRTVKAVQDAIGDHDPRNGDVHRAVRRAQVLATRGALRAYLRLKHLTWPELPGYSQYDLERKITLFVNRGLGQKAPPAPDIEKQRAVEAQIERVFTHPDPVDEAPAAGRLQAYRELAETWALADIEAVVGDYGDWDRFKTIFLEGDAEYGGAWWPAFRAILAEEVKANDRVRSILNQQGLSKLLEGQIDIQAALKGIHIDLADILAEMRQGQEGAIAYALRESQRNWHGIQGDLGVEAIDGHEDQIRRLPTQLVIARYRVVPYLDRGDILADLLTWARQTEGPHALGRLYVAPGGLGKTRLTIEALRQLDLEGWRCTFLAPRNTGRMAAGALADIMRMDDCEGVCLVLDYAEGQQDLLRDVCSAAADVHQGRVRIIALARSPEGWWSDLSNDRDIAGVFEAEPHHTIEAPLTPEERKELFDRAHVGFTRELTQLDLAAPLADPTAALAGRDLDRPLMVAMAAFLAARGQLEGGSSVLEQMYREERRHWMRHLGVQNGNDPRVVRLHRLAAQITLVQSATHAGALALTAADPLAAQDTPLEREATVAAGERLYGTRYGDLLWLRSVEPDLLGEHVAMQALASDTHGLAVATLRTALASSPLYASDPASLLTVLARAQRREHEQGVRDASVRAVFAIEAMVSELDTEAIGLLEVALPRFSLPLTTLALAVARRGVELLPGPTTEAERSSYANSLSNLAARLSETGDRQSALDHARRAVEIYEELAHTNPATYLSDLAGNLNNLANRLSDTGDRQGALDPARRAVQIYEKLASANPAESLSALAASLNNLANRLSETGDRQGALDHARRAVEIHEELVRTNPVAYLPDLAASLSNLASRLSETGERQEALDPARRAVEIREELARTNPAAYLPDLAISLNNLANRLSETGDRQGALDPSRRAVEIREELARANPAAYLPDLSMSLSNLASHLSETGDRKGALDPARRAVQIREELAQANPAAYLPNLAASLNNLANRLSETGDRQGALDPARRAVEIREELARINPAAYLPNLAGSLHNFANHLSETGDFQGALDHARRAVEIRKELARTNPAAYLPDLAMSLNSLANHLSETGDRQGALDSARRAVEIREDLARANPAAYLHNLANSLNNFATRLSETGHRQDALDPARRAVEICEELVRTNPAAYLPNLAISLNNLASHLSGMGNRQGAIDPARRAVEIYEQLALANPAAYLPDLAVSAFTLGNVAESTDIEMALSAYALSVRAATPMLETLLERLRPLVVGAVRKAKALRLAEGPSMSETEVIDGLQKLFGEPLIKMMRDAGHI